MPNFFATLKENLSNAKGKLVVAGFIGLNTINAFAADVAIGSDGAVTGSIDPKTFFGMATVVVALLGVIYGVKAGIRLLRG